MNKTSAKEFLECFYQDEKYQQIFQSKDDGQGNKDIEVVNKYGKIWHKTGSISEVGEWLNNNNKEGWGAFFVVNQLDQTLDPTRKRTENMLVNIRAVWCEDDNIKDEPRADWPIPPNIIVNSSPGKYHYYWITLTSQENKEQWRGVMQTMVTKYGCDNNAKDLVRVMRLPGFYHMKRIASPHMVTYSINKEGAYKWADILKAFPPSEIIEHKTPSNITKSETLTKTAQELINDYGTGHRHGPSSRMAMKLVNYNMPGDEIFAIIKGLFKDVSDRQHMESIDTAVQKKASEAKYDFYSTESGEKKKVPPHFNTDFVKDWPAPWPLIFRNYENCIYHVINEIYVPACFAFHGVMLGSVFRTVRGRGINVNMQIVSASGVGKDSNTSEPIEKITSTIKRQWKEGATESEQYGFKLLSPIYESVTADTTYLKTLQFEENIHGGLILNTESSGHWDMVANADNPHTEGVMRIEINAWDGHNISGKVVGKSRYSDIQNPNYTMLRLQQTEAIERNLTQRMIDIGLGNRIDYYADNIDRQEVASTELSGKEIVVDDTYMDFLKFVFKFVFINKGNQIKVITSKNGGVIHRFETETLLPLVNNKNMNRDEYKFIKRIIGSAEKQVSEIASFVVLWKMFNGENIDKYIIKKIGDIIIEIDGSEFEQYCLPLMEYQLKIRRFLYENILNTSQATAETEAIEEVWSRCIKKVSSQYKPWYDQGGIVATHFHARVKSHKFFAKNKKYDNPEKIERAIKNWLSITGLELKTINVNKTGFSKKRACYVIS